MQARTAHRDDERSARTEVLGVYDSIDEAEWAAGVLTHHGIGVDGISLVEPADGPPPTLAAESAHREAVAILTELVGASSRLFGWADHRPAGGRATTRPIMAVLRGTTGDADRAQRILADHAARAGRV
jgi:hypothetical protein